MRGQGDQEKIAAIEKIPHERKLAWALCPCVVAMRSGMMLGQLKMPAYHMAMPCLILKYFFDVTWEHLAGLADDAQAVRIGCCC